MSEDVWHGGQCDGCETITLVTTITDFGSEPYDLCFLCFHDSRWRERENARTNWLANLLIDTILRGSKSTMGRFLGPVLGLEGPDGR